MQERQGAHVPGIEAAGIFRGIELARFQPPALPPGIQWTQLATHGPQPVDDHGRCLVTLLPVSPGPEADPASLAGILGGQPRTPAQHRERFGLAECLAAQTANPRDSDRRSLTPGV